MAERGWWIDDVFKEQEYAREYKDDEEDLPLLEEIPPMDNILEDYEPVQRIPSEGWYSHSIVFFFISLLLFREIRFIKAMFLFWFVKINVNVCKYCNY